MVVYTIRVRAVRVRFPAARDRVLSNVWGTFVAPKEVWSEFDSRHPDFESVSEEVWFESAPPRLGKILGNS